MNSMNEINALMANLIDDPNIEIYRDYAALKQTNSVLMETISNLESQIHELDQGLVNLEYELSIETNLTDREEGSRRLFENIFHNLSIPTFLTDQHFIIQTCNTQACTLLGLELSDIVNAKLRRFLSDESSLELLKSMKLITSPPPLKNNKTLTLKNGLLVEYYVTRMVSNNQESYLFNFLPISFSTLNQQSFHVAHNLIEQLREGVMVTDENSKIIKVNKAFQDITGYSETEVLGKTPSILQSGRHSPNFYQEMWLKIQNSGWWAGEIWNKRKSGEIFPEWIQISRIRDDLTAKNFYVATFSDITHRKEHQNQLDRLAFYDTLTGLPNRRQFKQSLDVQIARYAISKPGVFAVLFIDLDKFKEVNDNYGHAEGDLLLREATHRLVSRIRENDLAARIGGDEFVMILTRLQSEEDAYLVAADLVEALSKPYKSKKGTHRISASIGIAFYPKDGVTTEDLMRRADSAMYLAKKNGRNRYDTFKAEDENLLKETAQLLQQVWRAIEMPIDHICMHYQPIFNTEKQLVKLEALVRLQNEQGQLIYPNQFITRVEDGGIMPAFGIAIFTKICHDIQTHQLPIDIKVAVNLSATQFQTEALANELLEVASRFNLNLTPFNFEITETATMQNLNVISAVLSQLQKASCDILLDDFGTGYASLSMLKNLPVDVLKIDMSFINEIEHSTETQDLVIGMIAMAKALKLKIISEGVENQWQFEWLKAQKVDFIQGYLLSKPIPLKDVLSLINKPI